MDFEIRPVTEDEVPLFLRTEHTAFGIHLEDEDLQWVRLVFEPERSLGVFDAGRLVATAGVVTQALTVPGNRSVPMAGVSWVSVQPTHRRRGILRQLMRRQLDDLHEAGEALVGLTASESLIYGRFGYGQASSTQTVRIDTNRAAFALPVEDDGRFTILDATAAAKLLPDLHERIRRTQNGDNSRDEGWWKSYLADPKIMRRDRSALFFVLHETAAGDPDGFATWRIKFELFEGRGNELHVEDLRALSDGTVAALWRFVLDVDLVGTVVAEGRAVDDPLRWRLLDPRRLQVTDEFDMLWLRSVDVAKALTARAYATDDELVLDITDEFCPWNTGRWLVSPAACTKAGRRRADLALGARDLGAAYLGGVPFSVLARAGRIDELTSGALRRADAMFSADRNPWTTREF
jgi:predicted acetyltransferase